MTEPLVVTGARLRSGGVVDVHCADGVVTALAPVGSSPPDGAVVVPADGGLVTEPFVDAHLHYPQTKHRTCRYNRRRIVGLSPL